MTVETDTKLLNTLEKFIETSNQKFDKINETMTLILVNQAMLEGKLQTFEAKIEGKLETINTKIETLQNGQNKIDSNLKDTKNEVSALYKWVIGTLIVAVIGAGNIFLKFFDLLPK